MSKPLLYVVTTNYDWDAHLTRFPLDELLADDIDPDIGPYRRLNIIGDDLDYEYSGGKELEERLQPYRSGPIVPCLELRPMVINMYLNRRHLIERIGATSYADLVDSIFLRMDRNNDFVRARLPEGFTHFDLVLNFFSNHGHWDKLLSLLDGDFSVRRVTIQRPNTPT